MKKRLLLVTNGFPFGESERSFLGEEVKRLAEAFDLLVLAPENQEKILYPTDGIVRIERYRFSSFREVCNISALLHIFQPSALREAWRFAKKRHFAGFVQSFKEILYYRFNVWQMEQKLGAIVQAEKIDIVYAYWCMEYAVAAVYLKKRFPNLKVITRFHGMDLYEERTAIGWQPFRRDIARGADGLCFACEYGRTYFIQRWGAEYADKMHICYLGSTDRGVTEPQQTETLRLVSCSNLVPLKRVELIIEGLALLPGSVQVRWDLFGDGAERQKLEALAAEKLQDRPNIAWKFHGFVQNAQLTEEYRRLSPQLFITTSSTEGGAPVSIQEVFSMGIPAVGTAVGGIPDLIVDGQTGFLLPEQAEPAHVADAILRFAALSGEQKRQMSEAARLRWSQKFDAGKNAVQFTDYLRKLASE